MSGPAATEELELRAIPENDLPATVRRVLASPPQARMLVAKGIAPLPPGELAIAVYQLSFDGEQAVKAAADGAPASLPDRLLIAALGEALPGPVLHYFATRLQPNRAEVHARILYNRATSDTTFAVLARRLEERELDIILQNEERLLRAPSIVEAAFFNRHARMSSVNRAIELCVRNGVRVEGIPSYDEIAKSIGADPTATDPEVADPSFGAAVEQAEAVGGPLEGAGGADGVPPGIDITTGIATVEEGGGAEPVPDIKKKAMIDFTKLKLHEKIRLATLGNAYCRSVLLRDANKMVAMASIKSPQVTENEIIRAAGNRALAEDVIRYIANKKDYVKMYPVKLALVHNPKCPIALSLRLLSFLFPDDLKGIARSKNIPSALSTTARKLVQQKGL